MNPLSHDNRTIEQIIADYELHVYKTCNHCNKPFKYGEHSIRTSTVVKYASGGQPDTFEKDIKEFHFECFKHGFKSPQKS